MGEYLDFDKISREIAFKDLLNYLNIPYREKKNEIKGEDKFAFIVNTGKNLFFCPQDEKIRGSVINFLAVHCDIGLRDAAKKLKKDFLAGPKKPERPIPELELEYCGFLKEYGISEETAQAFDVGLCKQRSVMAGKVAFKVSDSEGNKVGYIGRNIKKAKSEWFFPKGFRRDVVYNLNRVKQDYAILVVSPLDVLYLWQLQFPYSLALMGKSATDDQINQLKWYKRILIIHPEPQLISMRLSEYCFVKAVKMDSVKGLGREDIKCLF